LSSELKRWRRFLKPAVKQKLFFIIFGLNGSCTKPSLKIAFLRVLKHQQEVYGLLAASKTKVLVFSLLLLLFHSTENVHRHLKQATKLVLSNQPL